MRTAGTVLLLSALIVAAPLAAGRSQPRTAGLGSPHRPPAKIATGSRVVLVHDVMEWSGSLRHGEVGVVQAVADSESPGFQRFLVDRPNGATVWHEQDELVLSKGPEAHAEPDDPVATVESRGDAGCALRAHYAVEVTASSSPTDAQELAGRAPTAAMQDCATVQAVSCWLPDRSESGPMWLRAHLGERLHIKDLTVYKRGPAGLIRRIEGYEPRYDGHKTRTVFDGKDNIGCGTLVVRMPSLTPWSVDRLHFAIAPAEDWNSAKQTTAGEPSGIVSLEIFGLVDSCYARHVGESEDQTKLRKRMEEGFTGCSFSGVSFAEADRRIGGNPADLKPGEGDTGTCGSQ